MTSKKISIKTKFNTFKDLLIYIDSEGYYNKFKDFCRFRYDIISTEKLTYHEI